MVPGDLSVPEDPLVAGLTGGRGNFKDGAIHLADTVVAKKRFPALINLELQHEGL